MIFGTLTVGALGDVANQMILSGKSFGDVNLKSVFWAGVTNSALSVVGKGLSVLSNKAVLSNLENVIFSSITNSPMVGLGMAIDMAASENSEECTINDLLMQIIC